MQGFKARPFLINQLMRPVTAGRIVHAQIFSGPAGTGKKTAARYIAQALNCAGPSRPCGVCPSCLRFKDGNAPELMLISPEDKGSIKIDTVRKLIEDLSVRPENRVICVVIDRAERMTEAAQNALLKTLEEAPDYAVFMLLTERYTAILPTIRSRCTVLRFAPLPETEVAGALIEKGIAADRARECARMSGGSIGRALVIASDPGYKAAYDTLLKLFDGFKAAPDVPMVSRFTAQLKDSSRAALEIIEECASELMESGSLSPLAARMKANGLDGARILKAVLACAEALDANVSFVYAFENMLYAFTETNDS